MIMPLTASSGRAPWATSNSTRSMASVRANVASPSNLAPRSGASPSMTGTLVFGALGTVLRLPVVVAPDIVTATRRVLQGQS